MFGCQECGVGKKLTTVGRDPRCGAVNAVYHDFHYNDALDGDDNPCDDDPGDDDHLVGGAEGSGIRGGRKLSL